MRTCNELENEKNELEQPNIYSTDDMYNGLQKKIDILRLWKSIQDPTHIVTTKPITENKIKHLIRSTVYIIAILGMVTVS